MITLRRNRDRQHTKKDSNKYASTFYPQGDRDPLGDGFGFLVLLDEMRIPPGGSTEPAGDVEAERLTYLYKGALCQEKSSRNSDVMRAGDFQTMSMGHRVRCTETNESRSDWAHVFRIALRSPEVAVDDLRERKRFTTAQRRNLMCVVASPDGRNRSLRLYLDALVCSAILDPGHHLVHELLPGRRAWLHIIEGEATLNEVALTYGDGVGVENEPSVSVTVQESTELLLIDLGPPPRQREAEPKCEPGSTVGK